MGSLLWKSKQVYTYSLSRGCSLLLLALPERFGQMADALHHTDDGTRYSSELILHIKVRGVSKEGVQTHVCISSPALCPKASISCLFFEPLCLELWIHFSFVFSRPFFFSHTADRRTHKHLCPVLHTCQPCRWRSPFQLSKAKGQHGPHGTALICKPIWRRISSEVAGRNLGIHEQGWLLFSKPLYFSNFFGLERSLGTALIWPQGLGKEPPHSLSCRSTTASYLCLGWTLPSP